MKNKILITFLAILIAISGMDLVSAYDQLDITDVSYPSTINPGNTPSGTFKIKNSGTTSTTVTFNGFSLYDSAGRLLEITHLSNLVLSINQTQTVTFYIPVSATQYASTYTGTLNAMGATSSDSFGLTVAVASNNYPLTYSGGMSTAVLSGTTATGSATLSNNRNQDVLVNKAGKLISGSNTLTITSGTQTLDSASVNSVAYSINVPGTTPAGTYTGQMNLTYDSTKVLIIPVQLNVPQQPVITATPASLSFDKMRAGLSTTMTLNLKNDGNTDLSNVAVIPSNIADGDGDYANVTVTPSIVNITKGATKSVTVKVTVPDDMDSGDYSSSILLSGSGISKSIPLTVNVKDMLEITKVSISSDDDEDEFKPGEEMTFKVDVKNYADEMEISDITVQLQILDGSSVLEDDDGDEYDDEVDLSDLDGGDSDTAEFRFTMPYGISDGDDFTVYVEVTGEDEDGVEHTDIDENKTITAKKEDNEIQILESGLDISTLSCIRTTYFNLDLRNIGSHSEDVEVNIVNVGLGIEIVDLISDMSDDPDDDSFEVEKSYFLDLTDAAVGTYPLAVTVYYNDGEDKTSVTPSPAIKVEACGSSPEEEGEDAADEETEPEVDFHYADEETATSTQATATPPIVVRDTSKMSIGDNALLIALAVIVAIVVAGIIAVLISLARKR